VDWDESLNRAAAAGGHPKRKARWHVWVGFLVAALGLIWVLHDVDFQELAARLRLLDWTVVGLAVAFDTSSYLAQGWRWSLLLLPTGRLSSFRATEAIYAGLFLNEIVPMRLGEVLRGYVVSRRISASATAIASSIVVERILDGIWMMLAVGIVTFTITLPNSFLNAEKILALVMVVAMVLLVWAALRRSGHAPSTPLPSDWTSRLRTLPLRLADELGRTTRSPSLFGAFAISGIHLALQILAFWYVIVAYHIPLSIWQGTAVALIVRLGTMIPGPPSNIGTYQFFTVVGLSLFGVEKTVAAGFSFVVFFVLTFPLWVVGIVAFLNCGLSLRDFRSRKPQ
jgi:uncharacterized protein (TIRG00374 family)